MGSLNLLKVPLGDQITIISMDLPYIANMAPNMDGDMPVVFPFTLKFYGLRCHHGVFYSCLTSIEISCILKYQANDVVFCGRIIMFLAHFFPLSERSGLHIVSPFTLLIFFLLVMNVAILSSDTPVILFVYFDSSQH